MTIAIPSRTKKLRDNNSVTSAADAPITLRILISLDRVSTVKVTIPSKPRQATEMAMMAKNSSKPAVWRMPS